MSLAALDTSPAVAAVREALEGVDGWLVGGTIRDALLGRPIEDVDIAFAGEPEAVARAVAKAAGGPAFPLSDEFGGWRALARSGGWTCDVSRLQGGSIEADLAQRDFSINAMASPLHGGGLIDPQGGQSDLDAGRLRVLGAEAYAADPLRPLRLVRLAAELGFAPDATTEALTAEAAPRIPETSPERVFAELRRLMVSSRVVDGLALSDRLGVTRAVLPEIYELHGVQQSHFHHLDVHDHTVEVLAQQVELESKLEEVFGPDTAALSAVLDEPFADELTRREALRFGALLHDIGKPATRGVRDDGRVTFIGHDSVGEEMVSELCRRLRTSDRLRTFLGALTRHHLVLGFLVHHTPLSRRAVYTYLRVCSPVEVEVTVLSCADRLATRGKNADAAIDAHLALAGELMGEALRWRAGGGAPKAPIRGDELAEALGIDRGPELGKLLAALQEARFAGEIETRAEAVELARELSKNAQP
ncbi:MAG: poly(A) polymerase [Thermoleophilaceae bacterium]|jgi:putative nucleotidyltransferase with HDIG domain|nr:poly(A) polymerase [Thermoleophilaceae bacterium]